VRSLVGQPCRLLSFLLQLDSVHVLELECSWMVEYDIEAERVEVDETVQA